MDEKFANVQNQFLTLIIKYIIEGLALVLSAIMVLFILANQSFSTSFSLIGVIFLSLQKSYLLQIKYFHHGLVLTLKLIRLKKFLII